MKWNRFISDLKNPNPENDEFDIFYVESDSIDFAENIIDILYSDCDYRIKLSDIATHEYPSVENVKYYIETYISQFVVRVINADEIKELHLVD